MEPWRQRTHLPVQEPISALPVAWEAREAEDWVVREAEDWAAPVAWEAQGPASLVERQGIMVRARRDRAQPLLQPVGRYRHNNRQRLLPGLSELDRHPRGPV